MKIVRIGDYTNIKTGKLNANCESDNGKYPFFTCATTPLKIETYSYDCECVLVAGNGNLNVKYYNGKFDAYQRTYIIESKNKELLLVSYLFRFLENHIVKLREKAVGGVIKYIKLGNLTEALMPLPGIGLQKKITSNFDDLDKIIVLKNKQKTNLEMLIKSQFNEMFGDPYYNDYGYPKCTIRDIVSDVKYGTSKKGEDTGRYVYLRMNNITYDGYLDLKNLKYIDLPKSEVEKYKVCKGDILFNRTNSKELVGKTCVFDHDTPMVIAGYLIRVRVKEEINPVYLSNVLNSKYGKTVLKKMCKSIVGQANINAQEFQNIEILIPPIALQNQFADFVKQISEIKKEIEISINKLELLKKSLVQKYFG